MGGAENIQNLKSPPAISSSCSFLEKGCSDTHTALVM